MSLRDFFLWWTLFSALKGWAIVGVTMPFYPRSQTLFGNAIVLATPLPYHVRAMLRATAKQSFAAMPVPKQSLGTRELRPNQRFSARTQYLVVAEIQNHTE
jgi:hypothetical protein